MWNVSLPIGVVVLMFSVSECDSTARSLSSAVVSSNCRIERANVRHRGTPSYDIQ